MRTCPWRRVPGESQYDACDTDHPPSARLTRRSVSRSTASSPVPTTSDVTRTWLPVTEPHDATVSTTREYSFAWERTFPVDAVVSQRPETLSRTVHSPPAREYDSSDMRLPPLEYFLKRIAPPSRVIRHVRLLSPDAVNVVTILTPPSIGETARVSPPRSEQTTVRVPPEVVSVTDASRRARSENDDGEGVNTSSRENQRKPETFPSEGLPSETLKRTDPTDGPSKASQLPVVQELHEEHPSFERKSERPPKVRCRACTHELDQTSASPRKTLAIAVSSTTDTAFVISG